MEEPRFRVNEEVIGKGEVLFIGLGRGVRGGESEVKVKRKGK